MRWRPLLIVIVIVVAALLVPAPAHAIRFSILTEKFTLNITDTLFVAYHGNVGGLIVETDNMGRPTQQLRFADFVNRLNVDVSWRRFRLWTRFDTSVYMDRPAGACGPEASTPFVLRNRYCNKAFWGEKIALEYLGRNVEVTLGDFYVSFGRGLVLSIRKLDELGIDTTLRGGKLIFRDDNFGMTLVIGGTNIQNVDQSTGRFAADPYDFIAGARVENRFADKVNVGLHVTGGFAGRKLATQENRDSFMMYGGSIDAPKITRWLGAYLEGAGQVTTIADKRKNGGALYATATAYLGNVTLLFEAKYYKDYQPWHSSVPSSYVEFRPLVYLQPPTAERILTELLAPIFSVGGIRGRVDWRVNQKLQLFASMAYFEDDSITDKVYRFYDPYAGAEMRWNDGASHFFASGGYRYEQDRKTGAMHQEIGHAEWDLTQTLRRGWSLESSGFVYVRREDLVTAMRSDGSTYQVRWTEGTAYLALKWTPHLVLSGGYEWTMRPTAARTHHFFNGAVQWNITTASSIRFFIGGNRGGLRCISGICRDFPAFSGARLEVVVRL